MKIFYTNSQIHNPPYEIFNGEKEAHQEVLVRSENIFQALKRARFDIVSIGKNNSKLKEVMNKIHAENYINFFKSTSSLGEDYVYPSAFNYRSELGEPAHPVAKRGFFSFDLYTPMNGQTYEAATESANLALEATKHVLETGETAYALCRPPGHHAEPAKMGGYCYINNGAIAAETLREHGKVAILDVDFHHGNGAEKIFGNDSDVLTVSIHADPAKMFPYFSGKETKEYEENINYPLSLGTIDEQYQEVLEKALEEVKKHNPNNLVICFGADTHEDDPIGGFKLTTEYYQKMGQTIKALGLPAVILQEGGYNTSRLGDNVVSFLRGFGESTG